MTSPETNEFGIPLRCVDCPTVAPTLDEVRDIENIEFVLSVLMHNSDKIDRTQFESLPKWQDEIDHLKARKMVKLGILVSRTDGCTGARLLQEKMPNSEHIHHIACGC